MLAQGAEQLDEAAPLVGALMGVPTDERYPAPNLGRSDRRSAPSRC